jgi:sugar lactone lactonase YvrE
VSRLITACVPVLFALLLAAPASAAWTVERLVKGSPLRGIHGLGFGPDGAIYTGSVLGQSIYRIDPQSGEVRVFVPPTAGMADDLEFAPDGTLYWTGYLQGTLMVRPPRGGPRAIAAGLPGLNSLALNAEGRLFATQVFLGDALWEFDPTGAVAPRKLLEGVGGLNGFDFGPDGRLCGPLWFKGQVACIDVDSGTLEVVAEGFRVPAAANFDSQGRLHAIDNETGEVFRIDIAARTRTRVATAPTNLDNLAFDAHDHLYVTNMSDNAVYAVDTASGAVRSVISSPLTLPGGLGFAGGRLYVADTFTLSVVDPANGEVGDLSRSLAENGFPTALAASDTRLATTSVESRSAVLWDRSGGRPLMHWTGLGAPGAIALLDANRVVVAELAGGRLVELDAREPAARRLLAEGLAQPMGLALRADAWFVSESAAGRVSAIGRDGARRTVAEGLLRPEGLAFLPDGRLAVAETGAGRVLLLDPASGAREVIAAGLPLGITDVPGTPPGMFPTGLAAAPDGTLYLSVDREGAILRLREASGPGFAEATPVADMLGNAERR